MIFLFAEDSRHYLFKVCSEGGQTMYQRRFDERSEVRRHGYQVFKTS